MLERPALEHERASREPQRFLHDAVDDAPAAAAAEDHRVGTLQRLHALDVVEIAEVLRVIAHAIGEEIRRRALAADRRRIAVSFTLAHRNSGHVPDDVGHVLHGLVGHEVTVEDRDGLRNIAQLGVGARRAPGASRAVTGAAGRVGRNDDGRQRLRRCLTRSATDDDRLGVLEPRLEAGAAEERAERGWCGQRSRDTARLHRRDVVAGHLDAQTALPLEVRERGRERLGGDVEPVDAGRVGQRRLERTRVASAAIAGWAATAEAASAKTSAITGMRGIGALRTVFI